MDSSCSDRHQTPAGGGGDLHARIQAWAGELVRQGWIPQAQADFLAQSATPTAGDLFAGRERPLVAAFFGGTGVGKSTLLNRLAGQAVATTGVERPTSRAITFYVHESVPLERLPAELPLDRARVARHPNANRREVVWIDMPDIDSIERTNRHLALGLLPYIDVLIYVVSPERYRDDAGWRLLLEHSRGHAWLFVMNHWDEGCEEQIDDFTAQLQAAGFSEPIVLRCDSRPEIGRRKPDDFGKLEEILTALVRAHGVEQLATRNERLRIDRTAARLRTLLGALGEAQALDRLQARWQTIWEETVAAIEPALQWPVQTLAREVVNRGRIPSKGKTAARNRAPAETGGPDPGPTLLWDAWVRQFLSDALERLVLEADNLGFPHAPLRRRLDALAGELPSILLDQVQTSLQHSLATPGHWLQRGALRLFGSLRYGLPLAASGWVGYQLVLGYYLGFAGQSPYLGVDFAVHSLLLIGLAWLVPHLCHRLLTPSLEKAAMRGIKQGLARGFAQISERVEGHLHTLAGTRTSLAAEGDRLIRELLSSSAPETRQPVALEGVLGRMLAGG